MCLPRRFLLNPSLASIGGARGVICELEFVSANIRERKWQRRFLLFRASVRVTVIWSQLLRISRVPSFTSLTLEEGRKSYLPNYPLSLARGCLAARLRHAFANLPCLCDLLLSVQFLSDSLATTSAIHANFWQAPILSYTAQYLRPIFQIYMVGTKSQEILLQIHLHRRQRLHVLLAT